jgi:hypothetical protein
MTGVDRFHQRVVFLPSAQGFPRAAIDLKVTLNGKNSVLPMHGKELGTGLVAAVKKQLGLK